MKIAIASGITSTPSTQPSASKVSAPAPQGMLSYIKVRATSFLASVQARIVEDFRQDAMRKQSAIDMLY